MLVGKPLGPRVLVELEEIFSIEEMRAKTAEVRNSEGELLSSGLFLVQESKNKPRPTTGNIVALGDDPILAELGLTIGVRISFGPNAGYPQNLEGKKYRLLEAQEITMILPPL